MIRQLKTEIRKKLKTSCTHCGLPVPAGLLVADRKEQFCCGGCSAAWQLIHASGLGSFYRMVDGDSDQLSLQDRTGLKNSVDAFAEFDEATFLEKFASRELSGATIELSLDGIHCAACVWLIEKLPAIVSGVVSAQVNWARQTVTVRWNSELVNLSQVAASLHSLGYTPYPIKGKPSSKRREKENHQQLVRIGVAAAAAGNNMMIAAALYLGMFSFMSTGMESLLRVASCVVGMVSFLGPGRVFLRGAINAVKTRTPHMDLPIAVGLSAGSIAGLVNTVRGSGEIYFDSLSVLICLLLIGRWIQFRQQNRAADSVDMLYRLTPQRARKLVGGDFIGVSVDVLEEGDIIQVRPGDIIATDGVVVSGRSLIDESILTGESNVIKKVAGDFVSAGTQNSNSILEVEVTATGATTRISKILALVENAAANKPKIVQWANQIGGYFVCVVLLLAAVTFAAWLMLEPARAVDRAVALLIVACPCALAMATPLAIAVALGRLAKRRILVKSGDALQSLSRQGMIWLDKTGTLTHGQMKVNQWHGDRAWLPVIAEVESYFNHPIAHAIVDFACVTAELNSDKKNTNSHIIENVQSRPGGVTAIVDGQQFSIGNRQLLQENNVSIAEHDWGQIEFNIANNQFSPCWFAVNDKVVGLAGIGDSIRIDSKPVVSQLQQLGWQVGVLSGDHKSVVESVATQLGIETIQAGVTPEQKLAIVQQSTSSFETTVMVGDGVNDCAALAAATVGIAVKGGAEASLAAAPVYLGSNGLSSICELLHSSRSTMHTIRINFAASLGYNVLGIVLAMTGWLDPLVAAILMPISSLTVLSLSANAARKYQN